MSKDRLSVSYSDSYEVVKFALIDENDHTVTTREYSVNDLPLDNSAHVHAYGLNKVLTDRTSGQKSKAAKLLEMDEVFELLKEGEWAKERVVGAIVVSPEVEALAAMQNMTIADTQTALAQYDKDTRKAILGREDVQRAAKAIRGGRKEAPIKTLDDMIPEKA